MNGFVFSERPLVRYTVSPSAVPPTSLGFRNDVVIICPSVNRCLFNCTAAPASPAPGDVYISIGDTAVDFGIHIYALLGQAYRYSGSTWETVAGYVYTNGSWIQFSSEGETK